MYHMCREIKCKKCHGSTWAGCGKHLESTFKNITYKNRCWCGYNPEQINDIIKTYNQKHSKSYGPFPIVSTNSYTTF